MNDYNVVESWTEGKYRVRIVHDQFADSPRDDGDMLTEIVTWRHETTGVGDRGMSHDEATIVSNAYDLAARKGMSRPDADAYMWSRLTRFLRRRGAVLVKPLSGIDHSGISVWIADSPGATSPFDAEGWDSGQWGFVVVWQSQVDLLGAPADSLERQARAEVEEYDSYLKGEVFGYIITAKHDESCPVEVCPHDEPISSVWGFVGYDEHGTTWAEREARDELVALRPSEKKKE